METEYDYFGYPVFNPSKPGFKVLGTQQMVEKAQEPSNIIWENLGIPTKVKNRRKIAVSIIIIVFLICILGCVGYVKILSARTRLRYPLINNCDKIEKQFKNKDEWLGFAIKDKQATMIFQGYGHYQCYCEKFS